MDGTRNWLPEGGFCGGGGNAGLEPHEMAEVVIANGEHVWLIMHNYYQACLSLLPANIENNLPMDAVYEGDRELKQPAFQVYPSGIIEVVPPSYLTRKE